MEPIGDSGEQTQHVIKITVVTSYATKNGYATNVDPKRNVAEIEVKAHFFPSHDATANVKMFPKTEDQTKNIIEESRGVTEHSKKFFGLVHKHPIVLVIRSTSEIDVPVEKIPDLQPAEEEDDDNDDEESEEEYDEFEEEIVIMDVRRKSIWRKWLEHPQPQPEKKGVPIEDLIEIPSLQEKTQESSLDEFLMEEKIEPVERQPVSCEPPDLSSVFDNM